MWSFIQGFELSYLVRGVRVSYWAIVHCAAVAPINLCTIAIQYTVKISRWNVWTTIYNILSNLHNTDHFCVMLHYTEDQYIYFAGTCQKCVKKNITPTPCGGFSAPAQILQYKYFASRIRTSGNTLLYVVTGTHRYHFVKLSYLKFFEFWVNNSVNTWYKYYDY